MITEYIADENVEDSAPHRQGSWASVVSTESSPAYAYALPSHTAMPVTCTSKFRQIEFKP